MSGPVGSTSRQSNSQPVHTPPAPTTAPPVPSATNHRNSAPANNPNGVNGASHHHHTTTGHSNHAHTTHNKVTKKKTESAVDPAQMYESLKNRIAALEEEEVIEEEEERAYAEEAQNSVRGMSETAIHSKYIELFAELKRMERDHAKEKQKLSKDKDAAKGQLTKANQTKTKMENLARELQKDNKRLREDGKRLAQCVEDAQEELLQMKNDISKRVDRAKLQDQKYRESPDIVVKVVCRYRAELFFKISRKMKLSKLFSTWTERMDPVIDPSQGAAKKGAGTQPKQPSSEPTAQYVFTHNGRSLEGDQTPEEVGMDDGDEILTIELMDLTEDVEEMEELPEIKRQKLKKEWAEDPQEARNTIEEIFDGVVRERLKDLLRQYELRERHFECVIRSKELELLLSRARAAEQKQLADNEKARAEKQQEEHLRIKKELEELQNGQSMLIDKLIACCKEPNAERTQRLFASLREELEKRGNSKLAPVTVPAPTAAPPPVPAADGPVGD